MKGEREEFTKSVDSVLGEGFKYEDFVNDPKLESFDAPTYPNYADDDDGETLIAIDANDHQVDVDTLDHYVGASVTLPIGD